VLISGVEQVNRVGGSEDGWRKKMNKGENFTFLTLTCSSSSSTRGDNFGINFVPGVCEGDVNGGNNGAHSILSPGFSSSSLPIHLICLEEGKSWDHRVLVPICLLSILKR